MADWSGKAVLITGAGGFIGSHLIDRLVELGARAKAFVHYRADGSWGWLDHSPYKKEIEVFAGDLADRDSVAQAMADTEIVFHLGALIAIPYSYQTPVSFIRTNAEGTLNILQTARQQAVERVVHTSTSEVYGTARRVPIDEEHPLQAQSPYAASKIAADKLAEAFHLSFGLPVVTVRPFNTFGPRQSARAVIPTIITQCLAGVDVRLGNLEPMRDFNYIANTVEGFIRAASTEVAVGRTINLGSGREIKIRELVGLIGKLLNQPVNVVSEESRVRPPLSEVDRLLADSSMAKRLLAWEPTISLEDGLHLTIQWFKKHLHLYRSGSYVV